MTKKTIKHFFQHNQIHFLVIVACVVMQMFTFGDAYRTFAYLNLVIVITSLYSLIKSGESISKLSWLRNILFYPVCFALLHFLATKEFVIIKEMRQLLIAVTLGTAVVMLANKCRHYIQENLYWITTLVIGVYVIGQLVALFFYDGIYGTTKNPHYLAFYSAISLVVSIYCFFRGANYFKWFFGVCIVLLGFLLLNTGSRPAWIGLMLSAIIAIVFFLDKSMKIKALMGLIGLLLTLSLTNAGGFFERSNNLIQGIAKEERVTIWRDTWAMQMDSSVYEWVVGHGIDTFEDDFKPYSAYHHQEQIDFNSPHNYLLEILYLSGSLGVALFLMMLCAFYKKIIHCIFADNDYKGLYIMLFSIFTSCFIFASITLPFFNSNSMNMMAYVVGAIFFLETISKQKMNDE